MLFIENDRDHQFSFLMDIFRIWLMDDIGHVLQANYAHTYEAESSNGSKRTIRIKPGDKYILLKKTNDDWWDVIPYDEVRHDLFLHSKFLLGSRRQAFLCSKYICKARRST